MAAQSRIVDILERAVKDLPVGTQFGTISRHAVLRDMVHVLAIPIDVNDINLKWQAGRHIPSLADAGGNIHSVLASNGNAVAATHHSLQPMVFWQTSASRTERIAAIGGKETAQHVCADKHDIVFHQHAANLNCSNIRLGLGMTIVGIVKVRAMSGSQHAISANADVPLKHELGSMAITKQNLTPFSSLLPESCWRNARHRLQSCLRNRCG